MGDTLIPHQTMTDRPPTVVREFPDHAPPNVIFLRAADGASATLSWGALVTGAGQIETVGFVTELPWASLYLGDILTWAVRWQRASGLAKLLVPVRHAVETATLRHYGAIETVLAHVSFTQVRVPVDTQSAQPVPPGQAGQVVRNWVVPDALPAEHGPPPAGRRQPPVVSSVAPVDGGPSPAPVPPVRPPLRLGRPRGAGRRLVPARTPEADG